jgi:nickel/cobalt exporter
MRARLTRWTIPALLCVMASSAHALTAGPFGNALPDEGGFGILAWFPRLLGPFIAAQIAFQRKLTAGIHAVAHDPRALAGLLSLSFAYGVLHAIGPGHGKAVVSSYVLATRQTLRNGILLAFLSSLAQALVAIGIAMVAASVLHLTSVGIADATVKMELVADVAILLLGLRLVWSKVLRPVVMRRKPVDLFATAGGDIALPVASRFRADAGEDVARDHAPDCDCGQLHMPPAALSEGRLDWSKAWMVLLTTGLRPCSGALIVLAFAMSQHVLAAGVAATAAMGLGTFLTVASLAALTVASRSGAFRLVTVETRVGRWLARGVEAGAALAVLAFGLVLLVSHILIARGWG